MITRLSLVFQGNDLLVVDVVPQVELAMLQLVEMKCSPGVSLASLSKGTSYKGVTLSGQVEPALSDLHENLITAAIDFMDKRFSALQQTPLNDFKILDFSQWPYEQAKLLSYGVNEVQRLVDHYSQLLTDEEVEGAPLEWQTFKQHVSKLRSSDIRTVYRDLLLQAPGKIKNILPLIEIMMVNSMSTATVERSFSQMNIIKSPGRSLLRNDSLNNCMEVKINGPTLDEYEPDAAIYHWLNSGKGNKHLNGHALSL